MPSLTHVVFIQRLEELECLLPPLPPGKVLQERPEYNVHVLGGTAQPLQQGVGVAVGDQTSLFSALLDIESGASEYGHLRPKHRR